MSLMQCRGCPAKFVVGLLRCPRCGQMSELFAPPDQGDDVPKISVHGGPSSADGAVKPEPAAEQAEAVEPVVPTGGGGADPVPEVDTSAVEAVAEEPAPEIPAEPAPVKTPARASKKTAAAKP